MTSLRARFILAGCLIVIATAASATWSGYTFARLGSVVDETLRGSQEAIDLTATLSSTLEREDDALLLAVGGKLEPARRDLVTERARFDDAYRRLLVVLASSDAQDLARSLRRDVNGYRHLGDQLFGLGGGVTARAFYHEQVNPALRQAVASCGAIRERSFAAVRASGVFARDAARSATWVVGAVAAAALGLSTLVAIFLSRAVLRPVSVLTRSVDAIRRGEFDRRVPVVTTDELGALAVGFNRMAESVAAFHRSNLGEILRIKETLEATLRALPDPVVVIGAGGTVESLNPSARRLFPIADGATAAIDALPLPADALQAIRDVLTGARTADYLADPSRAFPIAGRDGRRVFLPRVAAMLAPEAKHRVVVLVLHDVTDFVRLDELRMELIAVTSHELKTPLTTMRLNLLLLTERRDHLSDRQLEMVTTAARGCEELRATVDQLLDLTRIEASQLRLSLERVDLLAVIEHVASPLRPRFEEARVALTVEPWSQPAVVLADPSRLTIAVSNLLTNALKYTPAGGQVRVRAWVDEGDAGSIHLAVIDTGIGVPDSYRDRVFEKFFRVEHQNPATPAQVPGAGIGLYLCRQIVEAHGGTVRCTAGEGDRGTCFELRLPAYRGSNISSCLSPDPG